MLKFAKGHWLFVLPLANFAVFYTGQNVLGLLWASPDLVVTFIGALTLSVVSYVIAYLLIPVEWAGLMLRAEWPPKALEWLCLAILAGFILVMALACITAEHIPVIEAFKGAPSDQLFGDRNNFLRERVGPGQLLNYSHAILTQGLMPFALTYAFYARLRWRFWALALLAMALATTLAKSAFIAIALPLIALFIMQKRWRSAAATFAGFVASIALMSVLASGVVGAWMAKAEGQKVAVRQVELPADTPAQYNAFGERNVVALLTNRVVWIPYATALDWFRYQRERLGGGYVMGRSIRPVAMLMGRERLHLEKEVAALQWGVSAGTTSNAVFFADAWLNWGVLGVIIYSAFFAWTIRMIETTEFQPLLAAAALPVWLACVSALTPVYFSGGLGFLLLSAMTLRAPAVALQVAERRRAAPIGPEERDNAPA
ncbi:hypothetical protein [Bradyrhizobium sp. BWC-3-1]|uniref:hypothetical protein n=1 Tax=Bradyrhizobium sp. BWC-3-1 TaxID=3080012 RepID=UPI00293F1764|nr:hypothetical protein [Bradyrhizobium sp. BWC-3-1]WOH55313.1 hypothetical protein RX329_23675 [Bradyrhizobium sp. BWC-3-1]